MESSVCVNGGNDRKDKGTIQSIQGLRGYASLCIFISHCNYLMNEKGENCFRWLGGFGVSVFIMISGYLLMYRYFDDHMPKSFSLLKNCLKKFYLLHIITLIAAVPFNLSVLFGGGCIYLLQKYFCVDGEKQKPQFYNSIFIFIFIVVVIITIVSISINSEIFSVCVWSLPTIILLYSLITGEEHSILIKNIFTNKIIKFVGDISFEFFMVHVLVIRYLTKIASVLDVADMLWVFLLAFFISITIAFFLHTILKKYKGKIKSIN